MNNFTLQFNVVNSTFVFNFTFTQSRELMKKFNRLGTDVYIMNITLDDCYGHIGDRIFSGSASLGIMANSVNYGDMPNIPVYGCYFRPNDDTSNYPHSRFGITIDTNSPCGSASPPFERFEFQYPHYYNNQFAFETIDGTQPAQTNTGSFNETQGWVSLWTIINAIVDYTIPVLTGDYGTATYDITVDTNVPFFDSYSNFHQYVLNGSTNGLLNGYIAPSEESFGRYYIDNLVSNNGNISDILNDYYYKFDGDEKCLGFSSDDGIHATLHSFKGGPRTIWKSENRGDTYEEVNSYPTSYYIATDLTVPAYKMVFNTNIPVFVSDENDSGFEKLKSFVTGDETSSGRKYTGDDAWNRSQLDESVNGKIGELVNQTENGASSIVYGDGVQMFSLTATQKGAFLRQILSGDVMDALSDATKLFGAGAISALQSLRYMPIDAADVCTLSAANSCQIGSYTHTFSSAVDRIQRNDKMINCGTEWFKPPYNAGDFRNLEPWCKLYVALPYAGVHQLAISKYIGKQINIKLAVDVTTGACEYHLFASGLEMDSFTGTMGVQIPLTAEDNARQVASLQNGAIQTLSGLAQIGISASAAAASGGTLTPVAIAGGVSGASTMAQGLQNMNKEFIDAPIATKGASIGNLGDFGINHIYFIFAWANSIVPANELNLVGKPSNQGGTVSSFAGFLQCSAFNISDGFNGTQDELNEIAEIMSNGVYI